jgi:MinD-like ATPase involved in chromosome partitioning or flagellar assembly
VVIAVTSGKGSPGATWCVANLGVALARSHDTLVIDADPSGGALAAHLGYSPSRGLYPLSRHGVRPTTEQLAGEVEWRHGLRAIAGMPRAFGPEVLDLPALARAAAGLASIVLVDIGRLPGPGLPAVAACDRVLVVVRPGPAGVLATEQALVALDGAAASAKIALVVSGLRPRRRQDVAQLGELLGRPVAAVIPYDDGEAAAAADELRPVKGKTAKAFARLAATTADRVAVPGVGRSEPRHRRSRGGALDVAP